MLENPLAAVLPADQAGLVLVMLITIPISYLFSLIYNKYLFLALTMSLTIGFQSILFPTERWVLWGQQQLVYILVVFSPRKYVGHIVIAECFLALTLLHCYRLYSNYGINHFDITGIFMMQLFNYIGLAYNYQNGARPLEDLSLEQAGRRVVDKPNYLTYLGYVNFLPACLVGPTYEYVDFENYLNRTADYKSIPNTLNATLREAGLFVLVLAAYEASSIFPFERVSEPIFYEEYSLGYKLLYCVITIVHIELKYITVWSLGMISMRASGLTYNPVKNKKDTEGGVVAYDFGRVEASNVSNLYLSPSFKVKIDSWNISTQWALKRYIYETIYDPRDYKDDRQRRKVQFKAQLATAIVSALWHGVYIGYFFSFVHWLLLLQITNELHRQKMRQSSALYRFTQNFPSLSLLLENCISTFGMTYFGIAFHLMIWSRIWAFINNAQFLVFILFYLAFFLIVIMGVLGKAKKGKKGKDGKDGSD